jgi:DNA-binding GntR family transcriptional regulator
MTPAPRYRQIADDLRRRLAAGEFGLVGSRIPPIIELQKDYDCENNLNMIRHAQSVLIDEGLIEPRQGQGTFIIAMPPGQDDGAALAEAAEELKAALGSAQTALAKILARLAPAPGPGTLR